MLLTSFTHAQATSQLVINAITPEQDFMINVVFLCAIYSYIFPPKFSLYDYHFIAVKSPSFI